MLSRWLRRLPQENYRQVVGRHLVDHGLREAVGIGQRGDRFEVAHTPGGISPSQIPIESLVARCCVTAVSAERTIEKKYAAYWQDTCRGAHETDGGCPGCDMDQVDAQHDVGIGEGPTI